MERLIMILTLEKKLSTLPPIRSDDDITHWDPFKAGGKIWAITFGDKVLCSS